VRKERKHARKTAAERVFDSMGKPEEKGTS
jgi:hypothetical protein